MARRYRKSRRVSQRQYRARLAKYEKYRASSLDPVSFKEWNEPYRQSQFLKKEYKIYLSRFTKRKESARYGFRLTEEGAETQAWSYRDFKEQYLLMRNTLKEEVEMGERKSVGSVINEIINDQAYELSRAKANAVANYLLREERPMLIEKGYLRVETDEEGKQVDIVKKRNLALLIRQGQFVEEEVGLWNEIKDYYKILTNQGFTAREARDQIGQTYFESK